MSIMAQGASIADATRSSFADLIMLGGDVPAFVGRAPKYTGAAVVYLIDDFCIYARCTRKEMPEALKLAYSMASDRPEALFDRQVIGERFHEAAAA